MPALAAAAAWVGSVSRAAMSTSPLRSIFVRPLIGTHLLSPPEPAVPTPVPGTRVCPREGRGPLGNRGRGRGVSDRRPGRQQHIGVLPATVSHRLPPVLVPSYRCGDRHPRRGGPPHQRDLLLTQCAD